jgi:hypothetical protein
MTSASQHGAVAPGKYILYWAPLTKARQVERNVDAIRQLVFPYKCVELDEALGHARELRQKKLIPLLIECPNGARLDRAEIELQLTVRAAELRDRPRIR